MKEAAPLAAVRDADRCVARCEWALLCARGARQAAVIAALEAGHTLREVGGAMGVTAERARQVGKQSIAPGPEPE